MSILYSVASEVHCGDELWPTLHVWRMQEVNIDLLSWGLSWTLWAWAVPVATTCYYRTGLYQCLFLAFGYGCLS